MIIQLVKDAGGVVHQQSYACQEAVLAAQHVVVDVYKRQGSAYQDVHEQEVQLEQRAGP